MPVMPTAKRPSGFSIDSLISKEKPMSEKHCGPPRSLGLDPMRAEAALRASAASAAASSPPTCGCPSTSPSAAPRPPLPAQYATGLHPPMPHPAFLNATGTIHPSIPHPAAMGPSFPEGFQLPPGLEQHMHQQMLAAHANGLTAGLPGGYPGAGPMIPPGLGGLPPGGHHPGMHGLHPGLLTGVPQKDSFPFYTWLLSRHSSFLGHRLAGECMT